VSRCIDEPHSDKDPLNKELCSRCARIDFDTLFDGPRLPDTPSLESTAVGSIHDIIENHRCPFCRLLAHTVKSFGDLASGSPANVLCYVTPWRADRTEEGFQVDGEYTNISSQLMVEIKKGDTSMPKSELVPNIVRLQQPEAVGPRTLLSASYLPGFFDFGGVKGWIQECETNHQSSCGLSADINCPYLSSSFVVIDVDKYNPHSPSQALQKCDHRETRYVALSYVWNQGLGTLRDRCMSPQARFRYLSRNTKGSTVAGAVEVCKRLGERYLWVDELCTSADSNEKKAQISQMDSIYSHAAFTVIAALDRNSHPGLPGIDGPREQHFQRDTTELVGEKMLTLSKPSLSSCLARSSWKTRGWTFQEGVLSRRCLIFTDEEVFWCCHRGLRRESVGNVPESASTPGLSAFDTSSNNITSRDLGSKWEYLTYARLLDEYTKRKLTFPSDAVSAFNGLLNLLSRRFGPQFLTGHPLCNFITSLCWFGSSNMTARSNFPSWSWAGWTGDIAQDYYLIHTPIENNKSATLADVEPLSGGKYLRFMSQIANISLSQRLEGENGPRYFARGATPLMNSYLGRPQGRSFFAMTLPAGFDIRKHQASHNDCEFLMLARLRDSEFIKLTKMDLPSSKPEYVLALFIDRSGSHARRLGLLAIPAQIWDDASPQPATVVLE
jgi:hypothetical protein